MPVDPVAATTARSPSPRRPDADADHDADRSRRRRPRRRPAPPTPTATGRRRPPRRRRRDPDRHPDADQRPDRPRRRRRPGRAAGRHPGVPSILAARRPGGRHRQRHHLRQHRRSASIRPTASPNPALGKICCRPASSASSAPRRPLRVFVQGPPINNDPIPDGLLYTCRFDILGSALPGIYPLTNSNQLAQDPDAMFVCPVAGNDGQVTVVAGRPDLHAEHDADDHRHAVADADRHADADADVHPDRHADRARRPAPRPTRRPTRRRRRRPSRRRCSTSAPSASRDPIGAGQLLTYTITVHQRRRHGDRHHRHRRHAGGHDLRVRQLRPATAIRASAAPAP